MSELAQKTASMLDMLPAKEQQLAYEMLKRIVLAWDPDFTKLTPTEAEALRNAEAEIERGETIPAEDIDWDAPVVETDLTDEEKSIIPAREEYKAGGSIPLANL